MDVYIFLLFFKQVWDNLQSKYFSINEKLILEDIHIWMCIYGCTQ